MEIKFKSHAVIASNNVTVHFQKTQQTFTRLGRGALDKLREARRGREKDLRKILATSLDAMIVAKRQLINFETRGDIALSKVTVRLQIWRQTFKRLGTAAADKLQGSRHVMGNDFRELLAKSSGAIVLASEKIVNFGSQAVIALNKVAINLQETQKSFKGLGKGAVDKLQEARRTRENDLRMILANSLDATVVTDSDHRFVYANPKALDLFGVSPTNMKKFTIDTFLSHCQSLKLRRKWFAIRRDERYGKCKICRLDGNSRVADFIFVANFVSRQDLYRFDHVAPLGITRLKPSARMPIS